MGKWIYIFFFSGLFSVLELFLRNWGILFPAGAFFVFYTAVTFGNTAGFFCAVVCGMALDFTTGAEHPWTILTYCAVLYLAASWIGRVESDSIMLNFLPGLLIPLITFAGNVIFFSDHFFAALTGLYPGVLPAGAAGAIILPLMIYLLDTLNVKLSMPLYTDARFRRKML